MSKVLGILVTVVFATGLITGSASAKHPVKDVSLGTQGTIVAPNDDKGPGSYRAYNTDETSFDLSYEEYKERIALMEEINAPAAVSEAVDAEGKPLANDAEHPAQPWDGPEGINATTAVSEAVDAEGKPLANDAEHPAQPWDGPAN